MKKLVPDVQTSSVRRLAWLARNGDEEAKAELKRRLDETPAPAPPQRPNVRREDEQ